MKSTLIKSINQKISKILKNKSFIFWILSMVANVIMWLYTLMLGRVLTVVELGTLATLVSIQNILTTPASSISSMMGRYIPHLKNSHDQAQLSKFYRHYLATMILVGVVTMIGLILFENLIESVFHIQSSFLIIIYSPISLILYLIYFQRGVLSGHLSFHHLGMMALIESIIKLLLIFTTIIWPFSKLNFAVFGWSLSLLSMCALGHWLITRHKMVNSHRIEKEAILLIDQFSENWWYVANSFGSRLIIIVLMSMDMLLIKHFLADQAGIYALLGIVGKAILFLGTSLQSLINPKISTDLANNINPLPKFIKIMSIILFLSSSLYISFLIWPHQLSRLLIGEKSTLIIPYLNIYGLGILFWVVAICFQSFAVAMKNFTSQKIFLVTAIFQLLGLYLYHQSLSQIILVISSTYIACALAIVINTLYIHKKYQLKFS